MEKKISNKEIRGIALDIVNKASESASNYDAVDNVSQMLRNMFNNMQIAVEDIKSNPNCKCTNCECKK